MATTLSQLIADIEREQDETSWKRARRARRQRLLVQSTRTARRDLAEARTARRAQA